ncbi:putative nicotinate-nucleotide adenylyltransferase [Clostridiales bacterium]|nr:putative nicotinate-nucleotide adenylyltransferase [Clostridiales bacterium]
MNVADDFDFRSCREVAIMGGAFDPIHFGHLATAQTVYENFNVDKVVLMPLGDAPHKAMKGASAKNRYEMTRAAAASNDALGVSALEVERTGKTYTVDTIAKIIEINPKLCIYFVMGADEVFAVDTWKEPERLLKMCRFIAVTRPGFSGDREKRKTELLREKYGCDIYFLEVPAIDISSSELRDRIRTGKSVEYFMPAEALKYIEENNLYK